MEEQVVVTDGYLVRLRGGAGCNLFVLLDREEGVRIVLLVEFISVDSDCSLWQLNVQGPRNNKGDDFRFCK